MGLLDVCSHKSYWRGLNYFENKRVKPLKQINRNEFEADVEGAKTYHVHLDIAHPRKSTCTCPHAAGKSTICKHKVAVYFLSSLKKLKKQLMREIVITKNQKKGKKSTIKIVEEVARRYREYVDSLSIEEMKKMLVNNMVDSYMEGEDDPYEDEDCY